MAKILVNFPTRGRLSIFAATLLKWKNLLSGKHDVTFRIVLDADDEQMTAPKTLANLQKAKMIVDIGKGTGSKVEAINRGVAEACKGFDIVIAAADDFIPQVKGYDDVIAADFLRVSEHLPRPYDGALWYNDGLQKEEKICTLPIIGAELVQKWGWIYHPSYQSVFCDNEYTDVLAGKIVRVDSCPIKHEWSITGEDALKRRNEDKAVYAKDKANYERRKKEGFPGYPSKEADKPEVIKVEEPVDLDQLSDTDPLDALNLPAPRPVSDTRVIETVGIPRYTICLQKGGNENFHKVTLGILQAGVKQYQLQLIEGTNRRDMLSKATGHYAAIIPTDRWGLLDNYLALLAPWFGGMPDVVCMGARSRVDWNQGVKVSKQDQDKLKAFPDAGSVNDLVAEAAPNKSYGQPTPGLFSFSIKHMVPSRKEFATIRIEHTMHPTFLCPTKLEHLLLTDEHLKNADGKSHFLDDPENPGNRDDLVHWANCMAASGLLKMENRVLIPNKDPNLREVACCYEQIG
jgi:hypothetical protein